MTKRLCFGKPEGAGAAVNRLFTLIGQTGGMRRLVLLSSLVILVACGTPDLAFRDVAPVRVHLGGSIFDIRVKGRRAEVIRRNPQWAPRADSVVAEAGLAVERVSGCRVAQMRGDQARMEAALDCGAGAPPAPPRWPDLDCEIDLYDLYEDSASGGLYCQPVGG